MGEWRLPGFLYTSDLVQLGELKEDLRVMVGRSAEVCRKRGLKVNVGNCKVMVLNGEEGLQCEVHVDGIRLEHASEFKYLGCVLDEPGKDGAECSRKVASGRRFAGVIRSLVNARELQLECKHCLCLFLCMVVKQCYGKRKRDGQPQRIARL